MVCFVILHYIVFEETVKCVNSILNNIEGDKKIIIVDNASPNNSGKLLMEKYGDKSNIVVLKNSQNLGFARGNNVGYSYAKKKFNPDFIIVMNNDMEIFQSEFIEEIYKSYYEYKYAIMGADVYSTKVHKHQNPQASKNYSIDELKRKRFILSLKDKLKFVFALKWYIYKKFIKSNDQKSLKNSHIEDNFEENVVFDVPLHGSFYVFSREFIDIREECFFNKTFMYLESYILHYQALQDRLKMIYYPKLKVFHHEDVSTDKTYADGYKKAIFTNKCLLDSCNAFLELINKTKNN